MEGKAGVVRMVRTLRAELGRNHGTVQRGLVHVLVLVLV